jgi:hypothetical protein
MPRTTGFGHGISIAWRRQWRTGGRGHAGLGGTPGARMIGNGVICRQFGSRILRDSLSSRSHRTYQQDAARLIA